MSDGILSSPLYQRYARMWSSTEGIERRFSLQDRYMAVRTFVHAIDHLATRNDLTFDVQANAQGILRDGIYNALDHRATGREWRNIRHGYNNERDGPHPPTEAEEDRRCEQCGAIQPKPFTHCHAKNHVVVAPTPPSDAAMRAAREWMNTHHASFKTNKEREEALAAIITRHLAAPAEKQIYAAIIELGRRYQEAINGDAENAIKAAHYYLERVGVATLAREIATLCAAATTSSETPVGSEVPALDCLTRGHQWKQEGNKYTCTHCGTGVEFGVAATADRMPRLPFICGKCNVQQHADGICANCGADALRARPARRPIAGTDDNEGELR